MFDLEFDAPRGNTSLLIGVRIQHNIRSYASQRPFSIRPVEPRYSDRQADAPTAGRRGSQSSPPGGRRRDASLRRLHDAQRLPAPPEGGSTVAGRLRPPSDVLSRRRRLGFLHSSRSNGQTAALSTHFAESSARLSYRDTIIILSSIHKTCQLELVHKCKQASKC